MSVLQHISALPVATQPHVTPLGISDGAVKLIPPPVMVRGFTPVALTAAENTVATLQLPAGYMSVPKQFTLHYAVYAGSNTTWDMSLTIGGVTVSSATFSNISTFDSVVHVVADVANNKLWGVRLTDGRSAATVAATFTAWNSPTTCVLKITPGVPATLITCEVTEQR